MGKSGESAKMFQFPGSHRPKTEEGNSFINPDRYVELLNGLSACIGKMDHAAFNRLRDDSVPIVEKYSDAEIIGWINRAKRQGVGNESGWEQKPGFYAALVDEAMRRGLTPKTGKEEV